MNCWLSGTLGVDGTATIAALFDVPSVFTLTVFPSVIMTTVPLVDVKYTFAPMFLRADIVSECGCP